MMPCGSKACRPRLWKTMQQHPCREASGRATTACCCWQCCAWPGPPHPCLVRNARSRHLSQRCPPQQCSRSRRGGRRRRTAPPASCCTRPRWMALPGCWSGWSRPTPGTTTCPPSWCSRQPLQVGPVAGGWQERGGKQGAQRRGQHTSCRHLLPQPGSPAGLAFEKAAVFFADFLARRYGSVLPPRSRLPLVLTNRTVLGSGTSLPHIVHPWLPQAILGWGGGRL